MSTDEIQRRSLPMGKKTLTTRSIVIIGVVVAGLLVGGFFVYGVFAKRHRHIMRVSCLKQMGLAFLNYREMYGVLPFSDVDENHPVGDGWRVRILPFIEENEILAKLDLKARWNSDRNLPSLKSMPSMYGAFIESDVKTGLSSVIHIEPSHPINVAVRRLHPANANNSSMNVVLLVYERPVIAWTNPSDKQAKLKDGEGNPIEPVAVGFADGSATWYAPFAAVMFP